ncbi:ATP-dependent dethiobiotin synthetase BioD [Aeromonas enteropelogenes]|uniref:dethiobiotin synthase n=1 Tax=Aeromonas enteropelogenes TaxID=29489 RepID=UPI002B2EF5BF|nr:ATP-dependent dethiobiotin synthetase BioD [Aeromonas enteropelogenes]BEE21167.1 ATP-dependent dethiobiotin synthetase BioD [Aeromonas enteropelogenes]
MKSFFITGTDTDVGKTLVARTLLGEFSTQGIRCAGYKPVSAGCARTPDGLRNLDAVLLQEAASLALPYDLVNPFAYEPPIAPHIAASEVCQPIDMQGISEGLRKIEQAGAELTVVEGAGGWYLPLDRQHLMSDWVKQENMAVIMVVGAKLGCLNHALLTFAAIRNDNLPVAGWVINRLHGAMSHYQENLDTLRGLIPAPFLGEIPFVNNPLEANLQGRLDISPLL